MWRKLLQLSQVNRIPQDSFNEFIIQNGIRCKLQISDSSLHFCMRNEQ